jgi:hypothetical protein
MAYEGGTFKVNWLEWRVTSLHAGVQRRKFDAGNLAN